MWDLGGHITCLNQGPYSKNTDIPIVENTPPEITITEPIVERGFKIVKLPTIRVAGTAKDADGISVVTVNGKNANVDYSGYFYSEISLEDGENIIRVSPLI